MRIWLDLKCEEQAKDDEMKKCKSFHDIQWSLLKTFSMLIVNQFGPLNQGIGNRRVELKSLLKDGSIRIPSLI